MAASANRPSSDPFGWLLDSERGGSTGLVPRLPSRFEDAGFADPGPVPPQAEDQAWSRDAAPPVQEPEGPPVPRRRAERSPSPAVARHEARVERHVVVEERREVAARTPAPTAGPAAARPEPPRLTVRSPATAPEDAPARRGPLSAADRAEPRAAAATDAEQPGLRPTARRAPEEPVDSRTAHRPEPGTVAEPAGRWESRRPADPAPQRREPAPEPGPVVHVSIGRLEIRAVPEPARSVPPPLARRGQSLDEYLDRRNRGIVP